MENASILDFELKQRMTRRQVDVFSLSRIPAGHDQAARIGVGFYLSNQITDLVHSVLLRIISAKRAPQVTVNWSKIARRPPELRSVLLVGPLGPDVDAAR